MTVIPGRRLHSRALAAAAAVALALGLPACTSSTHRAAPQRTAAPSVARQPERSPSAPTTSAAPRPTDEFTISFAGDVHFMDRVGVRLARDPATVFGPAAGVLRRADLTMVNLETAITDGHGTPQAKAFVFHAPPEALVALRDAGVDVATMANNHGADFGAGGLADTLAAIKREHFPVIGVGSDEAQAFAPYRTTLNGVRVAIFAADQVQDETTLRLFSAGPDQAGVANAFNPRLLTAVRQAKRAGYVVIVYLHWGIEYQTCPSSLQTSLAGQLARAGATAVIGTHAHVLQGAGWLPNGTYVEYGLGNYLWWMSFGNNQDDNGVLTLTFRGGRVVANTFAPSHLDDRGVPVPARGSEKARILGEWKSDRNCTDLTARPPR